MGKPAHAISVEGGVECLNKTVRCDHRRLVAIRVGRRLIGEPSEKDLKCVGERGIGAGSEQIARHHHRRRWRLGHQRRGEDRVIAQPVARGLLTTSVLARSDERRVRAGGITDLCAALGERDDRFERADGDADRCLRTGGECRGRNLGLIGDRLPATRRHHVGGAEDLIGVVGWLLNLLDCHVALLLLRVLSFPSMTIVSHREPRRKSQTPLLARRWEGRARRVWRPRPGSPGREELAATP